MAVINILTNAGKAAKLNNDKVFSESFAA